MKEKYKLIKFVIKMILLDLSLVISQLDVSFNRFDIADYDIYTNNKNDLRTTFIERKRRKKLQENRLQLLEEIFNDTIIHEGVLYTKIDKNNNDFKKIMFFEDAFKKVSNMDGLKVMFKRDMFWRTWRLIEFGTEKKIVCYKCENVKNCSSCYGGGHWTIEENPPCPYEIFSLINEDRYCTVNYMKNVNINNRSCLLIVKHATLAESCDNPIETKWRVTRLYGKGKRFKRPNPNVICNGLENCEFSTVYKVRPEFVVFQIKNASNILLYSRIMKKDGNYACIDCLKKTENESITNNKPLLFNLLDRIKRKRENKHSVEKIIANVKKSKNVKKFPAKFFKHKFFEKHKKHFLLHNEIVNYSKNNNSLQETTTMSLCMKLERMERMKNMDDYLEFDNSDLFSKNSNCSKQKSYHEV